MYSVRSPTVAIFPPADGRHGKCETTVEAYPARAATELTPDAEALVEADLAGELGPRRWTYGELLADAEATWPRRCSLEYRPCERICCLVAEHPRMGDPGICRGVSRTQCPGAASRPAYRPRELQYVLEQSGAVGLFIVKAPKCHGAYDGGASPPRSRREAPKDPPIVDLGCTSAALYRRRGRGRRPFCRSGQAIRCRSSTLGTTRLPERRGAASPRHYQHCAVLDGTVGAQPAAQSSATCRCTFLRTGCGLLTLGAVQFGGRLIVARLFEPAQMLGHRRSRACGVRARRSDHAGRAARSPGRAAHRASIVEQMTVIGRRDGASGAGEAHPGGVRLRLPRRLRPDRERSPCPLADHRPTDSPKHA